MQAVSLAWWRRRACGHHLPQGQAPCQRCCSPCCHCALGGLQRAGAGQGWGESASRGVGGAPGETGRAVSRPASITSRQAMHERGSGGLGCYYRRKVCVPAIIPEAYHKRQQDALSHPYPHRHLGRCWDCSYPLVFRACYHSRGCRHRLQTAAFRRRRSRVAVTPVGCQRWRCHAQRIGCVPCTTALAALRVLAPPPSRSHWVWHQEAQQPRLQWSVVSVVELCRRRRSLAQRPLVASE